jgi:hypothetical protein
MKEEEDPTPEQMAVEAARNRVLGEAIQHYLRGRCVCVICEAVKDFESKLAPGHLKMLGELYLQPRDDD